MEESNSKSEAIFESLNLNPQLVINEALNIVDNLLDEAFDCFTKEASVLLKIEDADREAELSKGVERIKNLMQLTLDHHLQLWEKYCHRFCFHVPDGFSLTKANDSTGDDSPVFDSVANTHLDAELNSIRQKLALVAKETAVLTREVDVLERQSLTSNQLAGSIDEVLQLYKMHGTSQVFQELATVATEFRLKVMNLKRKMAEDNQHGRADKLRRANGDILRVQNGSGAHGMDLDEIEEFLEVFTKSN